MSNEVKNFWASGIFSAENNSFLCFYGLQKNPNRALIAFDGGLHRMNQIIQSRLFQNMMTIWISDLDIGLIYYLYRCIIQHHTRSKIETLQIPCKALKSFQIVNLDPFVQSV